MTPARAREAREIELFVGKHLALKVDTNGLVDIGAVINQALRLVTRAVARERAAWRREIKRLKADAVKHGWGARIEAADAMLDLLQRRNRGGKT